MSHQLLERPRSRQGVSEPQPELLIEEVRRRARRRRLFTAGVLALLAGVVGGVYALTSRSISRSPGRDSPTTGAGTGVALAATLTPDQPISLAIASSGDLYIGDRGRNNILERTPTGKFQVVAGTGAAGLTGDGGAANRAEVNDPTSLVVARNGMLYFAQVGNFRGPISSSGGMRTTVIREIAPSGTIRTVAGLHPSCPSGQIDSISAESALFYGARLSLKPSGALAVDASVCIGKNRGLGPNLLLTAARRFVKDISNPVPAVASVACGAGVSGQGFRVFACGSGGGHSRYGHTKELLVVRSNGSSTAYHAFRIGEFAVSHGEVVATYDINLVRVTSSSLVPLLTPAELARSLHVRTNAIADVYAPTVDAHGDIYFVASLFRRGCQNRILERTNRGTIRQIWASPTSRKNTCA
jgi:hypothetical protein